MLSQQSFNVCCCCYCCCCRKIYPLNNVVTSCAFNLIHVRKRNVSKSSVECSFRLFFFCAPKTQHYQSQKLFISYLNKDLGRWQVPNNCNTNDRYIPCHFAAPGLLNHNKDTFADGGCLFLKTTNERQSCKCHSNVLKARK